MAANIEAVRRRIRQNLRIKGNRPIEDVLDYLFISEGKYLRAGLTILSGQAGGGDMEKLIQAAAAFEMLHMATLVHDDIIDDSKLRRGRESVQSRFGKDVAVYTGDYILTRAFRFISDQQLEFLIPLSKGIEKICAGEIMQNMNRYNAALTYKEYLKIISGKTAALFYMCARAGAQIAGMNQRQQQCIANSAKHMGLAFQILDDCRDYEGDQKALRKRPGSDIENGIYTLPLILALQSNEIPQLSAWMKADRTELVAAAVRTSKGLRQARTMAEAYLQKALNELSYFADNKSIAHLSHIYRRMMEG